MALSILEQCEQSIFKICNDYVKTLNDPTVEVFDFDANIAVTTWPQGKNLVGVGDLTMQNTGSMYIVSCSLTVATLANDSNIKKLKKLVGGLFDTLQVGEVAGSIVDENGQPIGSLVVMQDLTVLPAGNTSTRPLREIAVQFGVTYVSPPV